MRDTTTKIIISTIFIYIVALCINIYQQSLEITLNGSPYITLQMGSEYVEQGATVTLFGKKLATSAHIKSNLNENEFGTYQISYSFPLANSKTVKRDVKIVDITYPEIFLNGRDIQTLYIGNKYIEQGAQAFDDFDGDLTDDIVISGSVDAKTSGTYTIVYSVKDKYGNETKSKRQVIVKRPEDKEDTIANYIKTKKYNTKGQDISVGYYNLVTGATYLYNADKIYYGASLIKTLDALYLYDNNKVTDYRKALVKDAISVSDNFSHQELVEIIGRSTLKKYALDLGAKIPLGEDQDNFGETTIKDQLVYWKKLYDLVKDGKNDELKNFFINRYYNYLEPSSLTIMHKFGDFEEYFHDVGIVFAEEPYIVAILTTHNYVDEQKVISDISDLVYECHLNQDF